MKKQIYLLSTLLAIGTSAFATTMPDQSILASGKWTKIRVNADAVYQLTYDELAALGYDNPGIVKVYGYSPSLLLTHSTKKIPSDLSQIYTLNVPEEKKIFFYLTDNYNSSPEIWRTETQTSYVNDHLRHPHSIGATYFLSDTEVEAVPVPQVSAPSRYSSELSFTSHQAVFFHENDELLTGSGGAWYIETPSITVENGVSHEFTVSHLASNKAAIYYASLLAPINANSNNYMVARFSDGITTEKNVGFTPQLLGDKYEFNPSLRYMPLSLPLTVEPKTHTVTFSINEGGLQKKACALDYFAIIYNRTNNVGVRPQTLMYYKNWSSTDKQSFQLTDINTTDWKIWNVTNPLNIQEVRMIQDGPNYYGALVPTSMYVPNEVVAFNLRENQPSPEIIGSVENQNLHAMSVPDMLIITSTPMLGSAEIAASVHRRLQGLEVAVVDQLKIFNEFGSGNVSPEAVRRFIQHLATREPNKLKGVLMFGPGTTDNRNRINEDSHYVITAQCEDYTQANNITTNYCSDIFFVATGDPITSSPWNSRHSSLQVLANPISIGVGRLPFESPAKINDYYSKVETYLTQLPTYPSIGNVIVASDYSTVYETRTHMGDAEELIKAFNPETAGKSVTITRCASNLFSPRDNTILKNMLKQTLARGAQFYGYFGHGSATNISTTTPVMDAVLDLQSASASNYPGKAPFMFFASCKVAAFDIFSNTLAETLVNNPNGGAMSVISSGREVYPERNLALGCCIVKRYDSATDRTPYGQIWATAMNDFISENTNSKLSIANALDYNMIGDPMVPVYRATHSVVIDPIEGNTLSNSAAKAISGTILNADGTPATDFNGTVILTFYDPVQTVTNVINNQNDEEPPYLRTVDTDQEVIGQTTAKVVNGKFEVMTKAPLSSKKGERRIQAYAYSTDATQRGLGYIEGISFNTEGSSEASTADPISIEEFTAEVANGNTNHKFKVKLTATINAPAGMANSTSVMSPLRLWIDNAAMTDAGHLVKSNGHGSYTLEYSTGELNFGLHTASILALDADGNWAEESLSFMLDNTPSASLSAAIDNGEVNFEVASDMGTSDNRLVVEKLNGDIAIDEDFTGNSHSVNLAPGAYRAYVQLKSGTAATATNKLHIVVD